MSKITQCPACGEEFEKPYDQYGHQMPGMPPADHYYYHQLEDIAHARGAKRDAATKANPDVTQMERSEIIGNIDDV